jgi:hypothetical protein
LNTRLAIRATQLNWLKTKIKIKNNAGLISNASPAFSFYMKKIIILIACLGWFASAQSQRSIDMWLTMVSPIEYDFVQNGKPMDVRVNVKNMGPGTMDITDTVIISLFYDGDSVINGGKPMQKWYQGNLKPGEDATFDFYTGLNRTYNEGGVHIYCVDLAYRGRNKTNPGTDNNLSNNRNCHHVYVTPFSSGVNAQSANMATNTILVSPVPCTGNVNLSYSVPENAEGKIVVTDILGKEVIELGKELMTQGSYTRNIDVSTLSPGVYFANLIMNGSTSSVKFIKQ